MKLYRLEIGHVRPERASLFVTIRGSAEEVRRKAVEALRGVAGRWGVSPLALDWELTTQGASA